MKRLFFTLLTLITVLQPASAALLITEDDITAKAIVQVLDVETEHSESPGVKAKHHKVVVKVISVQKGGLKVDQVITIKYSDIKRDRPHYGGAVYGPDLEEGQIARITLGRNGQPIAAGGVSLR